MAEIRILSLDLLLWISLAVTFTALVAIYVFSRRQQVLYQNLYRAERQRAEAQKEHALLSFAISTSLNEIYLFDADSRHFRFVNTGALKNLGYSMEQMRSMTPLDIKPELEPQVFDGFVHALLSHARPEQIFETVHQRADGSRYPVEVHLQLFEYEEEQVFLAVVNDISARRLAEKSLQENEARLEQAQAMAHVGNWEIDLVAKTMWASAEAFRIYGLERTSPYLPLAQAQQVPLPEERPRLDAALAALLARREKYDLEFNIRRPSDGSLRVVHSMADVEVNASGTPVRVIGVIQDITDRKQAEYSLRESEERYRALFQNEHVIMLLIDPENGAILDANPAASHFYGWSVAELVQMKVSQLNTLPQAVIQESMNLARSGQRQTFSFQHQKKDGQVCEVEAFSGPIYLDGRLLLYSILHDVSERRRTEAQVAAQMTELRRWHTATLGREKRIMELKEEVNQLLVQAGHLPRYIHRDAQDES